METVTNSDQAILKAIDLFSNNKTHIVDGSWSNGVGSAEDFTLISKSGIEIMTIKNEQIANLISKEWLFEYNGVLFITNDGKEALERCQPV